MCGIVGMLQREQPVDPVVLKRMTAALLHRGPDAQGLRYLTAGGASVGLGHTRLRVIDLSDAAAQPMGNEDGSLWLVFNGEIYNFQALRSMLEQRGVTFRSASDTEVILRLYEAEGTACVQRLDGMFAFALWDGRRQRLLLARDRVGKKPLFYTHTPTLFAFGSEIKALLQHPAIRAEVDRTALPAFFLYGYVPNPRTLYRGIHQLPPGHLMEIGPGGQVRLERYWDLLAARPALPPLSEREAAARLRELLTEAVRIRLVADVPLGAFLSGGIDSSIVVGLMSRLTSQPVRTFSIGFSGDARYDETPYARLVAKQFGAVHTECVVGPSSMDLVERLVWHHDGPFADESAVPTYLLSQMTREHVTVALNGDGGDELFGGYRRFPASLAAERIPLVLRRAAKRAAAGLPSGGAYGSASRQLKTFIDSAPLPLVERFSRWASIFYDDLPQLLPGFSGAENGSHPLAWLEPHLARCHDTSVLAKLLYLNLQTYLVDDMMIKADRCSMAHALEARSPFLDRALLEYVFALPDAMKVRGAQTKVLLRQAFADLLPAPILRRPKRGFSAPLHAWFAKDLGDYLRDLLLAPDARLRAYVNQEYVRRLLDGQRAGRQDAASRLWTVLTFEVWLRALPAWSTPEGWRDTTMMPVEGR